ncbi:MAG TPA: hypothetical protein DCY03_01435, partial [Planctomycetaceae bacterium]|nr:hypothetical protein [Planctomycetaceae bacterium]
WLVWDGPVGMNVFMTTNAVHLTPPRVWKDYLGIARANRGWQTVAEKYAVTTFIVHKEKQVQLDKQVRRLEGFKVVYEDDLSLVVSREPQLIAAASQNEIEDSEQPVNENQEVQP